MHRRVFITELTAATTALALTPAVGCARKRKQNLREKNQTTRLKPSDQARVVLVHCSQVTQSGHKVSRQKVQAMLKKGLRALTGVDYRTALKRWIRPVDRVGLKVNCLAGRQMSTHLELVEELVTLMQQAGLSRSQAVVFDRADLDLRRGGFPIRLSGHDYHCLGNDRGGYDRRLTVMPNGASRFSQIATHKCSVLINMPILKDHGLAGISGALKNNFGLIHNPNKFHLNGCDPHVAEVNDQPFIRQKQRLVICDALRVQTEGGPAFHAAGAVSYGGLLLATDPVALDTVAWEILEQLRKRRKLPTLASDKREPVHIHTAAKKRLGQGQRNKITRVKIEVS